jgi:MFS family permease
MAFAIIGGMAATGFLVGIVIGGLCAQYLNWRWLFFITAMMTGIMILSAFFIVPKEAGEEVKQNQIPLGQRYKEIDWLGQFLSISGLVMLSVSLT